MKFTKLSLITLLALTGVYASESRISGDAKIFYNTDDIDNHDMFDKSTSMGDASISIDYTKKVTDNISLNAGVTGVSTLGLEGTAVGATWVEHELKDRAWLDTANIEATFGKTTAVIGRQKLDTPLAFTETWNIVENTFDAFTFINADIPKSKIIASAVTRANGGAFTNLQGGMTDLGDGIYTVGIVTKLLSDTTAQAWYYEANGLVDTKKTWFQVDTEVVKGLNLGVQYAMDDKDAVFVAGKIGYDIDKLSTYVAVSQADDKGGQVNFANFSGFGGSKAYTEAWWNFGYVTNADASTIAGGASYDLGSIKLTAQYITVDSGALKNDMDELTITADTSIGGIDASLAFINTTADDKNFDGNTIQTYFTLPFSL